MAKKQSAEARRRTQVRTAAVIVAAAGLLLAADAVYTAENPRSGGVTGEAIRSFRQSADDAILVEAMEAQRAKQKTVVDEDALPDLTLGLFDVEPDFDLAHTPRVVRDPTGKVPPKLYCHSSLRHHATESVQWCANKKDRRHGPYVEFFPNTEVKLQGVHDNDVPVGEWREFHDNGTLKGQGEYRFGLLHGRWTYNHPNGQRKSVGDYFRGMQHGMWTAYNERGERTDEGTYLNGLKSGSWSFFDERGDVVRTETWKDGNKTGEEVVDPKEGDAAVSPPTSEPSNDNSPSVEQP
ncbi:MAG: toxin-antitoxin system YwqK family antitoxin [Myxococcota bacterium]